MARHYCLVASCIASVALFLGACGGPGPDESAADDPETNDGAGANEGGEGGSDPGTAGTGGSAGSGGSDPGAAGEAGASGEGGSARTHVEYVEGIEVATLSGSSSPGFVDGPAEEARFDNPVNVVTTSKGEIYVCDFENGAIRLLASDGKVETVFEDAALIRPFGIIASGGKLYVEADGNTAGEVDTTTGTIWEIDPAQGTGIVLAENVGRPRGLAAASDGTLVTSDVAAHVMRTFDPETGAVSELAGKSGETGFEDGTAAQARFYHPYGVAWRASDELVVADLGNHAIRIVSLSGKVTTLAGTGVAGMVDGAVEEAQFDEPKDVAVAEDGTIYVTDTGNHRIRRITPDGMVQTVAGDGEAGYSNGVGKEARFFAQEGLALTADGASLVVADGTGGEPVPYNRVRILSLDL